MSEFGFKDRSTANVNVSIYLRESRGNKYFCIRLNGDMEKEIRGESVRTERFAGKPLKLITKCGRHLSVGFNLKNSQLTLKHNGDDVEKLPQVEKVLQICRNKIKHSSTSDQRYVSLIRILNLPR